MSYVQSHVQKKTQSFWQTLFNVAFGSARSLVAQPAAILLLVLGASLGSSFLVNAAYYSLPGDPLYSLKIRLERTQIALMSNKKEITELKMEFARKRVYEIDQIMLKSEGSRETEKKVHIAVKTLKQNIESVREDVENNVPEKDMNIKIAMTLDSTSKELEATLEKKDLKLGDDVKKSVENTKDLAEDAGLTALQGGMGQPRATTSVEILPEDTKADEDVKKLLDEKAVELQDKFAELEKQYNQSQDPQVQKDMEDAKNVLEKMQKDMDEGNYDDVLKDIQALKKVFKIIEGVDTVSIDPGETDAQVAAADTATSTNEVRE